MEDLFDERSNNDFSLNGSFDKFDEIFSPEEKSTAFKTGNSSEQEFNSQFLNKFSDNFENSYNEKEENEDYNKILFLNKKTNRDEEIKQENKIITKDDNNNIIKTENKLSEKEELNKVSNIKTKQGRKNKDSDEERKHDKNYEDNIIYKLKSKIFNYYINDITKENSINKDIDFKKFQTKEFTHVLSKKNNEKLFTMKIKDILSKHPISTKFSTFDRFENKKIIEKIYRENKEINVIKILDLTFDELFIIYRRKLNNPEDIEELEKIKAKIDDLGLFGDNYSLKDVEDLIKKQEKNNDEEYVKKIKKACIEYKSWFINKKTRNSN